ncbi:MAG: response regulator [Algicola sp.]|nr:response regulator [Algicola sp.]
MRLVIIILLLFYAMNVTAITPAVRFEHLSINEGLSQNSVVGIVQDNQGFLWFGTEDGLNRYDGYQFKLFRHDLQDPHSLSSNYITTIFKDRDGQLWIGTRGGGLNRFDPQTQRFVRYVHIDNDPHSLSHNHVTAIAQDARGILWVGTRNAGLNAFDKNKGRFKQLKHNSKDANSLANNSITSLLTDSKGTLWIGMHGGLDGFDVDSRRFMHFKHDPSQPNSLNHDVVYSLFEDSKGQLWVGTYAGLGLLDAKTRQFSWFTHQTDDLNSLNANYVTAINEDLRGQLWVGTNLDGLNRFDRQRRHVSHYVHQPSERYSLSDNVVRTIYLDSNGLLWIGTNGGGVNKLNTDNQDFGHFKQRVSDPRSLNHNVVMSIYEDSKQTLWVGTYGGGINKLDKHGSGFEHIRHNPDNANSLSHDSVWAVAEDASGKMWFGTNGGGLNLYDPDTRQFKRFTLDRADSTSLSHNGIQTIEVDKKGRVWVGTGGGGINLFEPKSQSFKRLVHQPDNANSISGDNILILYSDNQHILWIGTWGGGLNRYDPQTGQFTRYRHDKSDPNSISADIITSVLQEGPDTYWVSTYGGGLNKFDVKTGQFKHYRVKDGLANDAVYGVLKDAVGRLWLSTNLGLSRFDPVTETFTNYDVTDGLQSNEFNGGAFFASTSGELFFGGINGFNRFYPQTIGLHQNPPALVFSDFLLFNKSVAILADDDKFTLPMAIDLLDRLSLTYHQNLVSFEFAALDHHSPMKNQYRYQLEGFDENWITADAKIRRANYTNLPSGQYTLRVKAANADGVWNEQGIAIGIDVTGPPWLSWWAYLIYGALALGLVYAVVHYRTEHKVLNHLMQLDKLKDTFLANTSHELRTPLNGIIGLAESMLDGATGELGDKTRANLAMVVTSGKRLGSLINDILDLSKFKKADIVLTQLPLDVYTLTDVVLKLSQPLIGNKTLTLRNEVPKDLPLVEADEDRLMQIMHNLVGNGIKFTESGLISVAATVITIAQEKWIKISVSDTGIGIAKDHFASIFDSFEQAHDDHENAFGGTGLGLSITRKLVELHGGTIKVDSSEGQGAEFVFTLKICDETATRSNSDNSFVIASPMYCQEDDKAASTVAGENDGSRFRLLLVDDEPINLHVLNNHLSLRHFQLVEAQDGEQALKALDEQGPFDLVLLDVMMPKLSGFEVCKKIRQQFAITELPVIFLTAKNQVHDLVQSFAVGANDHLTKPIAKHELLTRVDTHLQLLDINRALQKRLDEALNALNKN